MKVKSSKKVLHIIGRSSYDGTCIFAVRLAEMLLEYDSTFLFIQKGSADAELNNKKKIYLSDAKGQKNIITFLIAVIVLFIKNNFDVIHYHSGGRIVLLLSFLLRKKAKYIHHFHCGNLTCRSDRFYPNYIDLLMLRFLKTKSYQVAVSKRILDYYSKTVGESKNLLYIHNAVPLNFKQKEKINWTIGYIGQINNLKNFNSFLNCIGAVSHRFPDLKFIVKGDNYDQVDFKEMKIEFVPPSLDVESFYDRVDIILFPSAAFEGMPLIMLEAIALDTPFISMKIHAVTDVLNDYPLYVNGFKPEEVADRIEWYYNNQKERDVLTQIHRNIYSKHNYPEVVKKISNLYN